jgi:predicted dehydrogenase
VRIAIFGAGSIGKRHHANARALGHTVDVFDSDCLRGRRPATFEEADAVMICTPASTHEAVAEQLLAVGYRGPLFVEKPIALRSDAPVFKTWPHPVTMVGYNWRFYPAFRDLTGVLQKAARRYVRAIFYCGTDMLAWPGHGYGDPLLECSHELDLARFWFGPVEHVGVAHLSAASCHLWFRHQNAASIFEIHWEAPPRRQVTFETNCTTRMALDLGDYLYRSYVTELEHFLDSVCVERPTLAPFSDGLAVVELVEQARRLAA